jgi:hypothetical protein
MNRGIRSLIVAASTAALLNGCGAPADSATTATVASSASALTAAVTPAPGVYSVRAADGTVAFPKRACP